jgi:hypothetical protein
MHGYMYVCMYVFVKGMCVYIFTYMQICICIYTYIHTYSPPSPSRLPESDGLMGTILMWGDGWKNSAYTHIHTHTDMHVYTKHTNIHIYTHINILAYTYIHIQHACIHTYTHTHTARHRLPVYLNPTALWARS